MVCVLVAGQRGILRAIRKTRSLGFDVGCQVCGIELGQAQSGHVHTPVLRSGCKRHRVLLRLHRCGGPDKAWQPSAFAALRDAAQIGRSVAAASEETSLRPWPTVNTLRPCDCKPEMLTDSLKAQDQLSALRRNINMASTRFLTLAFRLMPVM